MRGGRSVARPFALPDDRQLLDASDQSCDLVGVLLEPMATGSTAIDDRIAERELERFGELLRMAAEEGPERPLAVASFESSLLDPDSHGRVVELLRLAIDDVVSDGVDVEVAFVGPAVSIGENHLGLVDRDIGPTPAGTAWFS